MLKFAAPVQWMASQTANVGAASTALCVTSYVCAAQERIVPALVQVVVDVTGTLLQAQTATRVLRAPTCLPVTT